MSPFKLKQAIQAASASVATAMFTSAVLFGCGTQEASPQVSLVFANYTARNMLMELLIPSAYAAVSSGKMCFKRVRFKTAGEATGADPSVDEDNIDFSPGEVSIATTSTELGDVTVPAGTYERIEFDLEKDCPGGVSGKSISFTNASGSFSSQDRISIKFEGTFEAALSGQQVTLGIQAIVDALNSVTADAQIKSALESASVKGTLGD